LDGAGRGELTNLDDAPYVTTFIEGDTLLKILIYSALIGAALMAPMAASAADTLNITVSQVGSDALISASGAVDTGAGEYKGNANWGGFVSGGFNISVGPDATTDFYSISFAGSSYSGGSHSSIFADSNSGDTVALIYGRGFELPTGYASGSPLSGASTFTGLSVTQLGLKNGLYEYDYGDGDKVLLNISGASGVPEPATWSMMLLGAAGIGALARSRRRLQTSVA
jgi:hypothetical protein